jgi:hypothetical protein
MIREAFALGQTVEVGGQICRSYLGGGKQDESKVDVDLKNLNTY